MLKNLLSILLANKPESVEAALEQTMTNGTKVEEHINAAIATIGEKLSLRRFQVVTKTDADAFGAYLHMGGRISVLSVLEGTTDEEAAKDVSMHIAALNPKYVSRDQVDASELNMNVKFLHNKL